MIGDIFLVFMCLRISDITREADASATVYTMVDMTRAHGLNIYKYLKYLLER